jgi:hypothetical protein
MNFESFNDMSTALIIWNTMKEDDVHVYIGKLRVENSKYYFVNDEKGWRATLEEEQLKELKPVTDDLKETLLNADYALSLSIGDLPDSNTDLYVATGMNWHD